MPGGFLGVDVFFVLSGFLISSLLLQEIERTSAVSFGQFYLRRARRLLPALLATLALSSVLVLLFARDAAAQFRQDAISSMLYVTNWWYVVRTCRTSRRWADRRCCSICGHWRWRNSSTCCGR